MCGNYLRYKKCTTHYIHRSELEAVVLARLQADCTFAKEHEGEFVALLEKKTRRRSEDSVKKNEKEYAEAKGRLEEIDRIINRLYEDKVSGELSTERFAKMLSNYETEQGELRSKCENLQVQISAAKAESNNVKQFLRAVKKFTEMPNLTSEIVSTLIERVEVGQAEKVDGVKKQGIRVIYNFIGDIHE